jgi:hypothetical protein
MSQCVEFLGLRVQHTGSLSTIWTLIIILVQKPRLNPAPSFPVLRFNAWQTTKDLLQMRSFWRFVAFTLITVNLKSIFRFSPIP